MINVIIATVYSIVAAAAYIWSRYTHKQKLSIYLKALANIGFLLIAIMSFFNNDCNNIYFFWVFLALLLRFLGDMILGLKNKFASKEYSLLSFGILFFLLGHIAYSVNFISQGGVFWWIFLFSLFLSFLIMNMTRLLNFKLNSAYVLIGYFYSFSASLMLISAVSFFLSFCPSILATLVLSGSLLLYISDCLLSAYFKKNFNNCKRLNLIVHTTYYLAQILLALSILFA